MAKTNTTTSNLTVKIIANDRGNPPGKLADAELQHVLTVGPSTGGPASSASLGRVPGGGSAAAH